MSLGRPGIFNRPPVGQTDGSLWYLDPGFGWKASGSALTFDGTTLTGAFALTNLTNQQVCYGSATGGISQSSALTFDGTNLSTTGQLISTVSTGTAPLVVSSTTAVTNLNASLLLGATWTAPGTIGSGTPNTGAFTTLSASSTSQLTGVVTTGDGTGAATVVINGAAGASRDLQFDTAGSLRWIFRCNSTAEGGSNSGSNFNLLARDDAGSTIDTPISINRVAGGTMTLARPVTASSTLSVTNTTNATSKTTGAFTTAGGGSFQKNIVGAQGFGLGVTSTATAAATTTITTSSTAVQIFTGSTTQTVTLPAANAFGSGVSFVLIIKNLSSGTVTINRAGSDTIDGGTSTTLAGGANAAATLMSDGVSQWALC